MPPYGNRTKKDKQIVCETAKNYVIKLLNLMKDDSNQRTLKTKHETALSTTASSASKTFGTVALLRAFFGQGTQKQQALTEVFTHATAKTICAAVALQGSRRGAISEDDRSRNTVAKVLSKATSVQIASLSSELAGKYIVIRYMPIDADCASFLGSVGAGAGVGACFGGPWGVLGGPAWGASSWVVGWTADGAVSTIGGTESKDMSFMFPDDDETADVDIHSERPICEEHVRKKVKGIQGVNSYLNPNSWKKTVRIPKDWIVTAMRLESNWKDGTNGNCKVTRYVNDVPQGVVLPQLGPCKLEIEIEALKARGYDWDVQVKMAKVDKVLGL